MAGLGESAFPIRLADEGTEVGKALLDAFFKASLELGDDLAGEEEVQCLFLGSAAGDVDRDEALDLAEDAVAEGEVESVVDEIREGLELLLVRGVQVQGRIRFGGVIKGAEAGIRKGDRIAIALGDEGFVAVVEIDRDRAVIDLVGDREGRLVLVRGADEIGVRRDLEDAASKS